MRAVWSGSDGLHIPFESVLYVAVQGDKAEVRLIGNVFFCIGAPGEFLEQWYAWLHRDLEETVVEIQPHPPAQWSHEDMRQAQDERRDTFQSDAALRRQIRQMQGGVDVT